ncbi:MAG: hypothetical protein DMG09_28580 [Acidobacteria bacterium]|nr:MAG: hypothetical protein DMG09_28580 [Acidobacteriota bacterium]
MSALKWVIPPLFLATAVAYEIRTSAFQSRMLAFYSRKLTYTVGQRSSRSIVFPKDGPFDVARGYTRISEFEERLRHGGFDVVEQARFSSDLARIVRIGLGDTKPDRRPAIRILVAFRDFRQLRRGPADRRAVASFHREP